MASLQRSVSQMLGARPKVGPFPAELIFPWVFISLTLFFVAHVCSLNWIWSIVLIAWGDATWWVVTGSAPWRFLARFIRFPVWCRGYARFLSLMTKTPPNLARKASRHQRHKQRTRPPRNLKTHKSRPLRT